jgi:hypothetical protein
LRHHALVRRSCAPSAAARVCSASACRRSRWPHEVAPIELRGSPGGYSGLHPAAGRVQSTAATACCRGSGPRFFGHHHDGRGCCRW